MEVDTGKPGGGTYEHEGVTYYFCSAGCRSAFIKDPVSYLVSAAVAAPSVGRRSGHGHQGGGAGAGTPWEFEVKAAPQMEGYVDVEYQCPCGCRPGARYQLGSNRAGSEHCCCGRVHFAGEGAEEQLRAYMGQRAKTNMDEDVSPYTYTSTEVTAPSGAKVPVAYAQPSRLRK
jgi:hypothetical protein